KFAQSFDKVTGCTGDAQSAAIQTLIESECVTQQIVTDGSGTVIGLCPTTTTTTTTTTSTTSTTSTTTTTTVATTSTTVPVWGDGSVQKGEDCDPPGSSCGGTSTCGGDCVCTCTVDSCPCDFLDPSVCLYPFPNDWFTVPDATTDTGRRVSF